MSSYCESCPKKLNKTCTEICSDLNNYLRRKESDKIIGIDRLYSDRHIERMEIPFDPAILENELAFEEIKKAYKKGQAGRDYTEKRWKEEQGD